MAMRHWYCYSFIYICISWASIVSSSDDLNFPSLLIPNTTFPPIDGSTLSLSQIVCQNYSAQSLNTSFPAPFIGILSAQNVGTTCVSTWTLGSGGSNGRGTIDIIANIFNLSWTVTLLPDPSNGGLVGAVDSLCSIQTPTISFTFYNASANATTTLNQFGTQIQEYTSSGLEQAACSELVEIAEVYLNDTIQNMNSFLEIFMNPVTPPPPLDNKTIPGIVNLVNNPVIGLLDYALNVAIGPKGFGFIVDKVTNGTDGTSIYYPAVLNKTGGVALDFITHSFAIGDYGTLTLSPQWVNLSGFDDWKDIELLEPVAPHTISSRTVLNNLQIVMELGLQFNVTNGPSLNEMAVMKANMRDSDLFFQNILQISRDNFALLDPSQYASIGCLGKTLTNLTFTYLNINFSMDNFAVEPMKGAPTQASLLLNSGVNIFAQAMSSALPVVISSQASDVDGKIPQVVQRLLANMTCPGPHFDGPTWDKASTLYASVGAVGAFFLVVLIAAIIMRCSEEDAKMENMPLLMSSAEMNKGNALLVNPEVPFLIRYGVLFVVLANIAMFISSNTSLGAAVYLRVYTPGGVVQLPSLFNFSLGNSVRDMWNAGVYALSILIALFSGAWPYAKLVLLLFCWCVPAKVLSLRRRGHILIMLDAMGKWSLIDTFVLMMMMVAFHFSLAPPVTSYTPAGSISFEAFVEPHFGFYSFVIATMLSLVMTHFVIKVHQFSVDSGYGKYTDTKRKAPWDSEGPKKRVVRLIFVTLLLLASAALLGWGIWIHSFNFEFKGAFGLLLRFIGDSNTSSYSVLRLGALFPESSIDANGLGTRFIQVSFFIFAVAMPIGYLVCLLVLWTVPMTYTSQNRLLTLTTTIHAWSALEVFVVSIIAALLELQQFAQFIIGNRCDLINKILSKYADDMLDHDDKCFDVEATLNTGCWVLFAACVIYVAVGAMVIRSCHNSLKDRIGRPHDVTINK